MISPPVGPPSDFVLDDEAPILSPIADISYRHYDGPLHTRTLRWWIVAVAGIRLVVRRWWFWLLLAFSCLPYPIFAFLLYLQASFGSSMDRMPFLAAAPGHKYATVFYRASDQHLFWLMMIALAVGASSIAADNRTNALQIYLSKPITKLDYLFGKWMGVFVTVFGAALVPSLLLYIFCLLTFNTDGFLKQEPWLIVQIVGACTVPSAAYASLVIGVSAWSKSPLIAGAVSAGLYFGTNAIARILYISLPHGGLTKGDPAAGVLVHNASLVGVVKGVVWNIYGVSLPVSMGRGGMPFAASPPVAPPTLWVVALATALLVVAGFAAARARIRAVEVVHG